GRNGGNLLAQRTCGRIAGIGEDLLAGGFLTFVERKKGLLRHIDFAAYLADFWHIAALELLRNVLERADIGGDILPFGAIATRCSGDEFTFLVPQRHRKPVNFRLSAERKLFGVVELQEAANTGNKVYHVLFAKRIVE